MVSYRGEINIHLIFGSARTEHGFYFSNSLYIPSKYIFSLNSVSVDSTICDIANFLIDKYGNFYYLYTNDETVAGKHVTVNCIVGYLD